MPWQLVLPLRHVTLSEASACLCTCSPCPAAPGSQAMLRPAYAAINHHARDGQPAIVFVPTRKHARMAALDLLTHAAADGAPYKFRQARRPPARSCITATACCHPAAC